MRLLTIERQKSDFVLEQTFKKVHFANVLYSFPEIQCKKKKEANPD